eukprot:4859349-Pleurochrysis_carterae.AAC.1
MPTQPQAPCAGCNLQPTYFQQSRRVGLPTFFELYADDERASFGRMVLSHLAGVVNNNHVLSPRMLNLLPPAYRQGEAEGEEAETSDEALTDKEVVEDMEAET